MSYQNNGDFLVCGTKDGSVFFWKTTIQKTKLSLKWICNKPITMDKRWFFLIVCSEDGNRENLEITRG